MASAIREKLQISCVVVHPVESAACATEEGSWWSEGPYTENPKITTGAGDHFNAGFSAARLCGFSPLASLALATCTSGHYVRSAQSPTPDQVVDLLTQARSLRSESRIWNTISFEGSEGCGKSADQSSCGSTEEIDHRGVVVTREPGEPSLKRTSVAFMRGLLQSIFPETELYLAASGANWCEN